MTHLKTPELAQVEISGTTRGAFLLRATMAAGAIVGVGGLSPFVGGALAQGGKGDIDILNYALTLEYLEAAFYARALGSVNMSRDVRTLAEEIGSNEEEHVDALKAAVESAGGTPVKKPGLSFGGAFANEKTFLRFANIFEDTGVSAYNGAAPMIRSADILAAAGSIVQIEARHAALIRMQRNRPPAPRAFDKASSMEAVLKAVKPFLT